MLKEKIETVEKIEFIDLKTQQKRIKPQIDQAIAHVLKHGQYIFGPEVKNLEEALKTYTGAEHAITCANGTDALQLLLMAHNIGPGDAVLVPTFTFASTAEVVALEKATPIFVDVCPKTFNISIESVKEAIARNQHLNIKGIIAVDLYGLPANYPELEAIAKANGLWLIADAAQSFGGKIGSSTVGSLTQATTTSFFPSKPLSCYGDGGAILTNDANTATLLASLRNHGCGAHRYDHIHVGLNSRLDSLQAGILIEKLKIFDEERQQRERIAQFYSNALKGVVQTPTVPETYTHAWGLYTIVCPDQTRDTLVSHLQTHEIPCNIYYHKPLHLQPIYHHYPRAQNQLPIAEKLCKNILSLPMNPYLTDAQLEYIVYHVIDAFN